MSTSGTNLMWYLLWAALGVGWSFLSFEWLKRDIQEIDPVNKPHQSPLVKMAAVRVMRFIVLIGLIYLALRMHIFYALTLVFAVTIARWVQVILYNRSLSHQSREENSHGSD